jgi:predicted amidohydrolase
MTRPVRIAAAAYPFDWLDDFDAYRAKISAWVADAADCDLLVFPEYGAMELASLGGRAVAADLEASLHEVARHAPARDALHAELAAAHGVHILAASARISRPACSWATAARAPRPVNRATLYGPQGRIGDQDKQVMTRFEREDWNVTGAPGLRVFDTAIGRLGVLICYDAEFPLLGRALAEAGVEIILVPSCTDTVAGYNRVRIGAMARALESQCVVVQAPTVGNADWSPAIDENRGAAGDLCAGGRVLAGKRRGGRGGDGRARLGQGHGRSGSGGAKPQGRAGAALPALGRECGARADTLALPLHHKLGPQPVQIVIDRGLIAPAVRPFQMFLHGDETALPENVQMPACRGLGDRQSLGDQRHAHAEFGRIRRPLTAKVLLRPGQQAQDLQPWRAGHGADLC